MYLLGIDIGGTKYHVRAVPHKGRPVDLVTPSQGNLHALGVKAMAKQLTLLVRRMQSRLGTRAYPAAVCAGISGLDDTRTVRALSAAMQQEAWWRHVDPNARRLVNDITIGLRAGTPSSFGIAILSGSGSNGYGVDPDGHEASVAGRGLWMADEGSGAQIGIDALHAVRRAEDGRGSRTLLTDMVFRHFRITSTQELLPTLLSNTFHKSDLAAMNELVEHSAQEGDKMAKEILHRAANELLLMADTLYGRLSFSRELVVDTVLIGGTINKNRVVLNLFLSGARKRRWMRPIPLSDDPVAGAIELARATVQ